MATGVQPERILKDLAKLWVDLSKQEEEKRSTGLRPAGVLRACAMTLIAAVEEEADAQSVSEAIAEIMHQHPSRVIVMKVKGDEDSLDARVLAQCWMPFGRRQQICCEQIEITASPSRVDDLPKLVLGLIAPDLPVVLWCHSEHLCRDAGFQQLFPLSNKLIVDSATFADSAAGLDFIREMIAQGRNTADLTWTRMTRLRQTVAQMFEGEKLLAGLQHLERIVVGYTGPETLLAAKQPACLQYLVKWLRVTLPKAKVDLEWQGAAAAAEITSVEFTGPDLSASLHLVEGGADVSVNGLRRRIPFPKQSPSDLMREELSIIGVDPVFRRCL